MIFVTVFSRTLAKFRAALTAVLSDTSAAVHAFITACLKLPFVKSDLARCNRAC